MQQIAKIVKSGVFHTKSCSENAQKCPSFWKLFSESKFTKNKN